MTGICEDLFVVELGAGSAAGAATGMFLADQGARVVKLEPPEGDRMRSALPSGWLVWNRGKESAVVDLRTPDGQAAAADLIAGADVVIEAFEAGQADAWGLGYDTLAARNPGLVYCSIKGFGSQGTYASLKGYDAVVMAKAGMFSRGEFAYRSGPIFMSALLASSGASHMAISGIMAALIGRDRTGAGQRVEATLFQGLNPIDYFMSYLGQLTAAAAKEPGAAPVAAAAAAPGQRVPVATRYGVNACSRDGRWLSFSPQLPHQARALMEVLDLGAALEDERFSSLPAFFTLEDADEWEQMVCDRVKERDLDEWVERGRANPDLPFEPILSAEEALDHPQIRHNGNVVTVDDPVAGPVEQVGPLALFGTTPAVIARSAPALGQHDPLPTPSAAPEPSTEPAFGAHPLAGTTIVEFGYFYAMPYGVTLAGALGARVIKIEDLNGDPMRWSFGPPEWGSMKTMEGKESIALDLRSDEGRAIAQRLVADADVFVLGFRPGVAERLGMDEATLRALNPKLVYVHASGYGSDGPLAHRPIYAGVAGAMSGSVHRQASSWLDPDYAREMSALELGIVIAPRLRGLTDGDANAALGVFSAILMGLRHQRRTGEGQFVATSMIAGNVLAYADDFNRYEGKPPLARPDAEQFGLGALYRLYQAAEGWVLFAASTQAEWQAAMKAADRSDLASDPRFATPADRATNDETLTAELGSLLRTRPAAAWEALFVPAGVACVEANPRQQHEVTPSDPVLREMGLTAEVEHPRFGTLVRYGAPVTLSGAPARLAPGCTFAQHTTALLAELGYDDAEVQRLSEAGTVGLPR